MKERCWAINILGHRCKLQANHKGQHIPSRQSSKLTRGLVRQAIAIGLKPKESKP